MDQYQCRGKLLKNFKDHWSYEFPRKRYGPMIGPYEFPPKLVWTNGAQSSLKVSVLTGVVAPYCAIPRDYLSDTPLLRAMGFLVSQHGQLGAIPPPPFLSISPLESMQSGGAITPHSKGVSQRYLRDTL